MIEQTTSIMQPDVELYSRENIKKRIHNTGLFWDSFCIVVKNNEKNVNVNINNNKYIEKSLKKVIEEIRKIFENAFNKNHNFSIAPIMIISQYYIREKTDNVIDLTNWLNEDQIAINKVLFDENIRPYLSSFSKMLGANCKEVIFFQSYYWDKSNQIETRDEIKGYEITWDTDINFVYPIPKKEIEGQHRLLKCLYSIFQNQDENFCDYSLKGKDGTLKMPGLILYTCGDEVIKTIIDYISKENRQKIINCEEFSLVTLKAFANFLFIGDDSLSIDSVIHEKIDLVELFEFADKFQLKALKDHCVNLITLCSRIDDLENIEILAHTYINESQIQQLFEYYKSSKFAEERLTLLISKN